MAIDGELTWRGVRFPDAMRVSLTSTYHSLTMRVLGRFLQQVGLIAPPVSIVLQLMNVLTLGQMLVALVGAVSAFGIGRILEGYGAS